MWAHEPPSSSPAKSPHLPPLLSAADKTCHVCRQLPSLQDDSPLPPPPSISVFRISRRGSAAFLCLQACSARHARCLHRDPCGNSLPGFHMTASSPESHSREWKIALLCMWVLGGSRVGWGDGGERRCNHRVNQNNLLGRALNF